MAMVITAEQQSTIDRIRADYPTAEFEEIPEQQVVAATYEAPDAYGVVFTVIERVHPDGLVTVRKLGKM